MVDKRWLLLREICAVFTYKPWPSSLLLITFIYVHNDNTSNDNSNKNGIVFLLQSSSESFRAGRSSYRGCCFTWTWSLCWSQLLHRNIFEFLKALWNVVCGVVQCGVVWGVVWSVQSAASSLILQPCVEKGLISPETTEKPSLSDCVTVNTQKHPLILDGLMGCLV